MRVLWTSHHCRPARLDRLVDEAQGGQSRADSVSKYSIARKEARETHYWLRLLKESDLTPDLDVTSQLDQANDLVRLLTAIVKTTRKNS